MSHTLDSLSVGNKNYISSDVSDSIPSQDVIMFINIKILFQAEELNVPVLTFDRCFLLEKCCSSLAALSVLAELQGLQSQPAWCERGQPVGRACVSDLPQAERSALHLLQECQRQDIHVGDAGAVLHPEGRAPAAQRLLHSGTGLHEEVGGALFTLSKAGKLPALRV